MAVTHLLRVVVTVGDLAAASAYYRDALGLDVGPEQVTCDPGWNALLGLDEGTTARIAAINFEREQLKLIAFDPPGAPYPQPRASNDQWFEHVALVAGDIESVWERLENAKTETVTEGAPVLLRPSTGSVTAFKFRDLEGHPLELISFPKGVGDARWQQGGGGLRGYDHTAIAVSDLDRSVAFYRELLGLRIAGRSLNQGPEQDRLDGLSSCLVDVVALQPTAAPTPHVELLHYRAPLGRTAAKPPDANNVSSVRQVHKVDGLDALVARLEGAGANFVSKGIVALKTGSKAASVRDPDGHMIVLID